MKRVAVVLLTLLCGCAQVRTELRDHPVRTVVFVGGGFALGALAIGKRADDARRGSWPAICNTQPESCR